MQAGCGQRLFWENALHHGVEAVPEFRGNNALSPPPATSGLIDMMPVPQARGWLCLTPDPVTTEPQSWVFHCVFLPATVPPIFASSSCCRAASKLSLQATFRLQSRGALALALQLQGRHPQGPACTVGQRGCRTRHTCQWLSWELLECWDCGQTDPRAPGV